MSADMASRSTKSDSVSNSKARSSKDLSFKPRFRHLYGLDEKYYEFALKYKDNWSDKLFFVDEELVANGLSREKGVLFPVIQESQLVMDEIESNVIGKSAFLKAFGVSDGSLKFELSRGEKWNKREDLKFGESVDLGSAIGRKGLVLNAGGHVTSMHWLRNESNVSSNDYQYLAVSIIRDPRGLESSINSPELSIFSRKAPSVIKSGIEIWKYDLSTNSLTLVYFYDSSPLGATNNLRWLPVTIASSNILGVLVGSFTDGKLHLLKIPAISQKDPQYRIINKPSLTYEFISREGEPSGVGAGITDYEFVGHDKVLVGMTNGYVSEYTLPILTGKLEELDLDINELSLPSFIQRISDSVINSIMVAQVGDSQYVTIINTAGTECWAFENRNPKGRILQSFSTISAIKPSYNPSLRVFIGSYSSDGINFNFIRGPQEAPNNLLKVDGAVTSLKSAEYTGHPLHICGTSHGEIFVINYSRKFLNGSKMTNKTLSPLKIWKVALKNDTIELKGDLIPVPAEKQTNISVTPPEIIASTVAWNENDFGSSVYTAGFAGGFIILERLDPKHA